MGLLIAFIDRVKAFNMKELKVTLYEIKDTEKNIKELALATADLVESVSDAAIMTEDFDEDRFKAALKKVRQMEEA